MALYIVKNKSSIEDSGVQVHLSGKDAIHILDDLPAKFSVSEPSSRPSSALDAHSVVQVSVLLRF